MLITTSRDSIKREIIVTLSKDPRTEWQRAAISDALEVVESFGVTPSNWQLSIASQAVLTQPALEAIREAEAAAQDVWRIDAQPLGLSAQPIL